MSAALRQETSHVARRRVRHLDVNHVTRQRVEDAIERLIGMLDEVDGDPDAEPSLGWSVTMAMGSADDREWDAGDECERVDEDGEAPETAGAGWCDVSTASIEARL